MTKENQENVATTAGAEHAEDSRALFILGTRYSTGRDVQQDLIAAHKWFNLAAMMGHEEARLNRADLAREMSTGDVAEAQRQARAWLWNRAKLKTTEQQAAKPATLVTDATRHSDATQLAPAGAEPSWKERGSLCA